ncbi:putative DNA (cytosine-5-)-methyltransferase [Helianthus annuus]|nr:putative DNA (cytosine-5-)-methyltransferase [Helianthus annuus]KAJ0553811.1 putative DNA (cytosine-5-)-methyltransferase [Helianthus annuus]KAJ0719470.1 putative DNA (cytosine-5-)-methyltransferase [Helianthus annuus]KAJ0722697.1 putative DNA (cytosine-5-)-methyltransferase [Helianthus annuus]KAJ0898203.1 putative DNA (cytosine-5-)-methyltransferase [Helianthus annuus]
MMRMLDLYSGCGAMSTDLCLGANMADVNLVMRWVVDLNKYACESLKLNHPETEVCDIRQTLCNYFIFQLMTLQNMFMPF